MITVDAIRSRVRNSFETIVSDLVGLVAIPSVSASSHDQSQVARSAEHVADLLRETGLEARVLSAPGPDGAPGRPAVLAHADGPAGAPHVLLYAHHDVQPVGELSRWSMDPYKAEVRGDRIYGRGSSDDGAGITVHLGSLSILGEDLPVNVVVFIEGEEEIGSPSFTAFLDAHKDELAADVIVVTDSSNWKVGEPAVTTTLRGNAIVTVDVTVADHAVHSGAFGGPLLDSVAVSSMLIASLFDEKGDVAVPGLGGSDHADVDWPEEELRAAAGMVEGLALAGSGDIAARMWTKPSISVIGFDARPVSNASNTIAPHTRFRLSMRTVPGVDPVEAQTKLVDYLLAHAPFGARVEVTAEDAGAGYQADMDSPVTKALHESLTEAWGVPSVNIGVGGSIPFISDFQRIFPSAQVVVTGVEDPLTNAHSEDESQSISDLKAAILAEALLLTRVASL
mgnify:CR=1 FL=1